MRLQFLFSIQCLDVKLKKKNTADILREERIKETLLCVKACECGSCVVWVDTMTAQNENIAKKRLEYIFFQKKRNFQSVENWKRNIFTAPKTHERTHGFVACFFFTVSLLCLVAAGRASSLVFTSGKGLAFGNMPHKTVAVDFTRSSTSGCANANTEVSPYFLCETANVGLSDDSCINHRPFLDYYVILCD